MKLKLKEIVENFLPAAEFCNFEPLSGGVSSDVFLIEVRLDNRLEKMVLKIEGGPAGENDIKKQFNLLQALNTSNLKSPKPLHVDTSCRILEKPFMLISYIDGCIELTKYSESFSPPYIDKMVEQLLEIHQIEISILPDLPIREDPLDNIMTYLPKGREWQEINQSMITWTSDLYKDRKVLLHGDFWSGNILWRNFSINGILDWEYAGIGDPLSDLAVTCLDLKYTHGKEVSDLFKSTYAHYEIIDEYRLSLWLIKVASSTLHFLNTWKFSQERRNTIRNECSFTIKEEFNKINSQK